jgi:sec-independent protein translocase protein TatA
MGPIGFREILIILLIVLILFGAKRIPDLMRSMGKGISEFKGGLRGEPPSGEDKKQEPKT